MFSWATERLEQLAQTVAPPPTDAVGRFLYSVQRNDESTAQGCLTEMMDPVYTVIQPTKGTYPIHLACQHGMERLMRQLLAIPGATTEQLDAMGNTALHYACLNTNSKTALHIVKLLVTEFSASVVAKNGTGQTPYDTATVNSVRQYLLPLQLQQETQHALDNGGVGLPPGIDMGGLQINYSNMPPPPMGGIPSHGVPSTPPPGGPPPIGPPGPFATPSPGMPPTAMSAPPSANSHPSSTSTNASAPTSGNHGYARTGHSSAAIGAASRYRPDGFHSSSSDVNLAKKYGNANSGNAPAIAPPPSSGNNPAAVASSNPYSAAAASSSSAPNPYARGGLPKSRYLSYDGKALPTPPTSATFNNFYGVPPAAAATTAAATPTGFTMFNPASRAPSVVAQTTPVQQGYDQGYQQSPAQQGYDTGYQQPPAQQGYDTGYQQPPAQQGYDTGYQQPPPQQGYEQGYHQPPAQQGYDHGYQQPPAQQGYEQGYQQPPTQQAYNEGYQQPPAQQGYDQGYQQLAVSPYQHPSPSAASLFLPPPPLSSVSRNPNPIRDARHVEHTPTTPHVRHNSSGYPAVTPSSGDPASFFASPPLQPQQQSAEQSVSLDYTTPLKVDPAAVFAAPPSGNVPVMPAHQPILHSVSTESIRSAQDLFASEPSQGVEVETEQTAYEDSPIINQEEEKKQEQEQHAPETSAGVEEVAVPSQPEPELSSSDNASPLESIPAAGVYDDSIADMQDVPLSEASPLHEKPRASPAAAATAQDFFGLPPPPKML